MRLAFVWDWEPAYEQSITWADGLAAALHWLSRRHEIKAFCPDKIDNTIPNPYITINARKNVVKAVKEYKPEAIIIWGDRSRPNMPLLAELKIPMFMCFSGGETDDGHFDLFTHIFVENEVYKRKLERRGLSASIAFGTNVNLFQPIPEQTKHFDVIFPATFALWKHHRLWSKAVTGFKSCAVGYMYDNHEAQCWQDCEQAGSLVLPHLSGVALHRLYASSRTCCITSDSSGGSQRTVLEAMAMNIPLILADHSDKTTEYATDEVMVVMAEKTRLHDAIEESLNKTVNTRDYIVHNWSHQCYGYSLEKGILEHL